MTNTTQQTFDLCRQVYKLKGWGLKIAHGQVISYDQDLRFYRNSNLGDEVLVTNEPVYNIRFVDPVPLYTSDYLLEKLPDHVVNHEHNFSYRLTMKKVGSLYFYEYSNHTWWRDNKGKFTKQGFNTETDDYAYYIKPVCSDENVQSVLKLTLALSDAGVELS